MIVTSHEIYTCNSNSTCLADAITPDVRPDDSASRKILANMNTHNSARSMLFSEALYFQTTLYAPRQTERAGLKDLAGSDTMTEITAAERKGLGGAWGCEVYRLLGVYMVCNTRRLA